MNGPFGNGYPYLNFHELNMDWVIRIAKDFLDQYTNIQQTIDQGLEDLDTKATELQGLLDAWYEEHSQDIADQLADALENLNTWYTQHEGYLDQYVTDSITAFGTAADAKAAQTIESIPDDYTTLSNDVSDIQGLLEIGTLSYLTDKVFRNGTINDTTGAVGTSGVWSVCEAFIKVNQNVPLIVTSTDGYKFKIYAYNTDDVSGYVETSGQQTGEYVVQNPYPYYRIVYTDASSHQPEPTTNPANIAMTQVKSEVVDDVKENAENIDKIESLLPVQNILENMRFVNGSINQDTGVPVTSGVWSLADGFVQVDPNVPLYLNCDAGYKYKVFSYNADNYQSYIEASEVQTGEYIISNPAPFYVFTYTTIGDVQPASTTNPEVLHFIQLNFNIPDDTVFVISKTGIHNTLSGGLNYAKQHGIKEIYVDSGEWDIVDELGDDFFINYTSDSLRGLPLGHGMHIVFSSKAKVVCNYLPSSDPTVNPLVNSLFSAFNVESGGFTIENLNIEASNIRYCIHDDRSASMLFYHNKYLNCIMQIDNTDNTNWPASNCIGGGCGGNGLIEVIGCAFKSVFTTQYNVLVSWHNSSAANAKSHIVIKDCYFDGDGTIGIYWYGESTEITTAFITNNSLGSDIITGGQSGSTNVNISVTSWNNEIRS